MFTFATGPGAVPSVARLSHQRAFHGLGRHRGAQHRLEDLHEVPLPDRRGAREIRPHQDDRAVRPVPVHAALGLPAKKPGDQPETVHARRPFVVRQIRQRPFPVHAPGKVQEEIDPREAVEQFLHLGGVGEVGEGDRGGPFSAARVDLQGDRLEDLGAAAGEDHGGPGPRKGGRGRLDQGDVARKGFPDHEQHDLADQVGVPREGGGRGEDAGRLLVGDAAHREAASADRPPERAFDDFERERGEVPGIDEGVPHRPFEGVPLQRFRGNVAPDAGARLRSLVEDAASPLDPLRGDRRRVEGEHGDPFPRERPRKVIPEGEFGGLRGGVRETTGVGVQDVVVDALAVEGSHHDDRPAPRLPLHDPCRLERRHPGPGEVDVDRLPVLVEIALLVRRAEHDRARDAGVVVQNVDAAELLLDLFEHLPDVFRIGHVALYEEGLVREAEVADQVVHVGLRFEERGGPPTGDHHVSRRVGPPRGPGFAPSPCRRR